MSTPATQESGVGGIEENNQPGETVMTSLLQGVKSSQSLFLISYGN